MRSIVLVLMLAATSGCTVSTFPNDPSSVCLGLDAAVCRKKEAK